MVRGSKMPIEKNAEKHETEHETVFITPANGTHAVLYYYPIIDYPIINKIDKVHAQKIKNKIMQSGFDDVKLVNANDRKLVRKLVSGKATDRFILSFDGTEYRGEKEINDFRGNYAVLKVYNGTSQTDIEELKEYLSGTGLRIVIDYTEVVAPVLYYKGEAIAITKLVLNMSKDGKNEIKNQLRL